MAIKNYVMIGRPNVGKTSIFNFLVKKYEGAVRDQDGTTKDWRSKVINDIRIWDSEGVYSVQEIPIEADKIFFVIENNVLNTDKQLYLQLKKRYKNIVTIINKIDLANKEEDYSFFENYIIVSIKQKIGVTDLLEAFDVEEHVLYSHNIWAIIGKPNVGKSSLINILAGKELHKVSDVAGTTREFLPVDIDEKVLLDTPGQGGKIFLPKNWNIFGTIVVIDLTQARQDLRLINLSIKENKPTIVIINKTDLAESSQDLHFIEAKINRIFDVPVIKISCTEGEQSKIKRMVETKIKQMEYNYSSRIKTAELNQWADVIRRAEPRVKFITQVETKPPMFLVDYKLKADKERMLRRRLVRNFDLLGIPIAIKYRN